MKQSPKRSRRGFSLIEIMVVITVLAVILGVALPMFSKSQSQAELRRVTNQLVGDLRRAQSFARSGKADVALWGSGVRTRVAGIRFINATQYALFVDRDTRANGSATEADMEVVDIASGGQPLRFLTVPAQIRFRSNGTLSTGLNAQVSIQDTNTSRVHVVEVTFAGRPRIIQ